MPVFSLRVDEKTLRLLRKRAKKEEKTSGKLIRQAIQEFLKKGENHD